MSPTIVMLMQLTQPRDRTVACMQTAQGLADHCHQLVHQLNETISTIKGDLSIAADSSSSSRPLVVLKPAVQKNKNKTKQKTKQPTTTTTATNRLGGNDRSYYYYKRSMAFDGADV